MAGSVERAVVQREVRALHEAVDPLTARRGQALGAGHDRAAQVLLGQPDPVLLLAMPQLVRRACPVAVEPAAELVAVGLALDRRAAGLEPLAPVPAVEG